MLNNTDNAVGITNDFSEFDEMRDTLWERGKAPEEKVRMFSGLCADNVLAVCVFADIICRCCEHTPKNPPKVIAEYLNAKKIIAPGKYDEAFEYITECYGTVHRVLDRTTHREVSEDFLYYTLSRVFYEINEHLSILPDGWIDRSKITPENFFALYKGDFAAHQVPADPSNAAEVFCEKAALTGTPTVNVAAAVFDAVLDYQRIDFDKYNKKLILGIDLHVYAELSELGPITTQALSDFHGSLTGSDNAGGLEELSTAARETVYTLRKDNVIGGSIFNKLCHLFDVCIPG